MTDIDIIEQLRTEIAQYQKCETAVGDVVNKLEAFITNVSHSDKLTKMQWEYGDKPDINCWQILNCKKSDCPARSVVTRCWLMDGTQCSISHKAFNTKIAQCLRCKVFDELRKAKSTYVDELINVLIHALMERDRELVTVAIHDSLTGAYNRWYLDEYLKHEMASAVRHADIISVITIDIDNFKTVNDTFGHAAGDEILIIVSNMLQTAIRSGDMLFRMGGDEFLIVFPRTACPGVEIVAERLLAEIEHWNISSKYKGFTLAVSLGCSVWKPGEDFKKVIAEADEHMYFMKKYNKNNNLTRI